MAEIEHFVDPNDKSHPKFESVKETILPLFSKELQLQALAPRTDISLGAAVAEGLIGNETLAYFMARTYSFLQAVGIRAEGIRFR